MNRIFIGYDPRQPVTYNVLQHSIAIHSQKPVSITPLIIQQLPIERMGLTPFTFTRFLVPWLCNYDGWGLFLDADMLVLDDINEIFDMAEDDKAVMAVTGPHKFEWASVMLFNCGHEDNKKLTPEYIETANKLHHLSWTENIGSLPPEWNHLVLYDDPDPTAKLVHYTGGVPIFPETQGCEYTQEWLNNAQAAVSTRPWAELMGNSVHVGRVRQHMENRNKHDSIVESAVI